MEFKDVNTPILIISGTLLFLLLILLIILVLYLYQRKRFLQFQEITLMKVQFEQTLLTTQNEIQEQTLRKISQELHDNIAQKLGLIKLQVSTLQYQNPNFDLADTKDVIVGAIADLRALSKSFHPDRIASIPLKDSIENELTLVKNASDITIQHTIDADEELLQPEQKVILFRIFQELLNNAIKYSQGTQIDISLTSANNSINLTVKDNGIGLPKNYQKGIGHTSIHNRVELLKGLFELSSVEGGGTKAVVAVPFG
jgi:signal transduction histidine kinase